MAPSPCSNALAALIDFELQASDLAGRNGSLSALVLSGGNPANAGVFGVYIHDPDPNRRRYRHHAVNSYSIANLPSSPPGTRWNWYAGGMNQMDAYTVAIGTRCRRWAARGTFTQPSSATPTPRSRDQVRRSWQ